MYTTFSPPRPLNTHACAFSQMTKLSESFADGRAFLALLNDANPVPACVRMYVCACVHVYVRADGRVEVRVSVRLRTGNGIVLWP